MKVLESLELAMESGEQIAAFYVTNHELAALCHELFDSGNVSPNEYTAPKLAQSIAAGNLTICGVPVRVARVL